MKKSISVLLAFIILLTLLCGCINTGSDKKTLFIYMCGSNLESKQGLAGKNIDEILSAEITDNINIVIETGGTVQWRSHDIDSDSLSRYEIKNGTLKLIETLEASSMGEAQTLTDFLDWGQKKYPSKHSSLILWDHGAGASQGICFDEKYGFDPLTIAELKSALENTELKNKLEFIGFDACLMASMETAYYVKDFANYMLASEEIEPSGGWDYKALCEAMSDKSDYIEIGREICDSFVQKCKEKEKMYATLSLFDLSQTDNLINQFSETVEFFDNYVENADYSFAVMDAINTCEKFGGDNSYQGSSNMLDLVDFVTKAGADDYKDKLNTDAFVLYTTNSGQRNIGGVSFYYPYVYNEQEIKKYIDLGVSDYYSKFLSDYYLNVPKKTIEYKDKGSVTDDGAFTVTLTPDSFNYLSHIDFILMNTDSEGIQHVLCTYNDIRKDWDNLKFDSNFRGVSLALDGHRLFCSAVSSNSDYITFIAPIMLNGERTNLRFVFVWDRTMFNNGYFMPVGTWNAFDENGLPDNDIIPLKEGDRVQVITDTVLTGKETVENFSEEFVIGSNGGEITEKPLDGKEYQYIFVATDIFGNTFTSDMATLEMIYSYSELLEHPLPDETFAAKVTKIEPYNTETSK